MSNNKKQKADWRLLLVGVVLGSVITVGAFWIYPSDFNKAKQSVVNKLRNLDWDWTGFFKGTTKEVSIERKTKGSPIEKFTVTTKYQSGKTLWNFLELAGTLAVPILIVVIGYQLEQREKKIEQREKKRTEKQAQYQLRAEDYLKKLGVFYREAKAVRRSLRAAGLTTKFENPPDTLSEVQVNAYKKEMQNLNHAQL